MKGSIKIRENKGEQGEQIFLQQYYKGEQLFYKNKGEQGEQGRTNLFVLPSE